MDSVLSSFIINAAQPRLILQGGASVGKMHPQHWPLSKPTVYLIDNGCGKPNHCGQNHPWDGGPWCYMEAD